MKNLSIVFSSFLMMILLLSCEEEPPFIDLKPIETDTSLTDTSFIDADPSFQPQIKNLLIEDFTGVRCTNCPTAQKIISDYAKDFPGRINIVAFHVTNNFATPYSNSKYDFRHEDAERIYDMLGRALGLPAINFDRLHFSAENQINITLQSQGAWSGYRDQRLIKSTPVNILLENDFDETENTIFLKVTLQYTEEVNVNNYLSILIAENDLVDLQDSPSGMIEDYQHNHVFRQMITSHRGTALNESLLKGRVFIKEYRFELAEGVIPENAEILVFVHERDDKYDVLQSAVISVR